MLCLNVLMDVWTEWKENEKLNLSIYFQNCCRLRLNTAAMNQTGTGQIMNLLSNDVIRFDQFTTFLNYIWIMPFMVILYLVKVFVYNSL